MSPSRAPTEVEAYLHAHIPISASMGVRVHECTISDVVIEASLEANLNHRATVFGGSASAVAILAAWTWLHWALLDEGLKCRVVIQRNQMDYELPIEADFTAHCAGLPPDDWTKMKRTLKRHGKARTSLKAGLRVAGQQVGEFSGDYVAVILPQS